MLSTPLSYYIMPLRHKYIFLSPLLEHTQCLVMHGRLKGNFVLELGWVAVGWGHLS